MPKKLMWKTDRVVSIKLRENLYTLAQMRVNTLVQFFDIQSENGIWDSTDLNLVNPIFCIYLSDAPLNELAHKILIDKITPNLRAIPNRMLTADYAYRDGVLEFSVRLVQLTERYESLGAVTIQEQVLPGNDLDLIYSHEFVGMEGSTKKLLTRLTRFFDTGVNWDEQKSFVFKGIPLPPARK